MAFKVIEQDGIWALAQESANLKFPGTVVSYELYKELHQTREFDKHFHRVKGKLVKRDQLSP